MGAMNVLSLPLMVGWGAWVMVGLALAFWARRVRAAATAVTAPVRPSGVRPPVRPKPPARPSSPSTPIPDAFGDLQALLDVPNSASRRPGD